MKSREFIIHNFRNIGVYKGKENPTSLWLSGIEKDSCGGLVIILGENNTGKSNLLKALEKFGKINDVVKSNGDIPQDILLQDIPNFCECTNALSKLQMKTSLSSYKIFHLYFPFELWEHEYGYGNDSKAEKEKAFKDFINDLQGKFNSCKVYGDFVNIINGFNNMDAINFIICCEKEQKFTLELTCDANLTCFHIEELKPQELELPQIKFHIQVKEDTGNRNVKKQNIEEFLTYLKNNKEHTEEESTTYFLDNQHKFKKGGNQYKNRIIFYQEEEIKNEHLITTSDKIHESLFFESLFNSIKLEIKDVQESYRRYMQESVPYYKQIEANVNEKLKKINKQFNDLYHKKDDGQPNDLEVNNNEIYHFKITMEVQQIALMIFKDNQIINLESQSVGFRKFFNLFFNLHNGETWVKEGNIILIDEAETHLSVPAQIEFRNFLKSFGMQNGLLFVITTHSPFMLDIKYLDEVRILKTKDNNDGFGIKIINDFSFINNKESEQANTLLKMKDALGVEYFHLLNPDSKPIFVEGITDYNYLTAFTLLYNYELEAEENPNILDSSYKQKKIEIVFLPISGLGKGDNGQSAPNNQRLEVMKSLDKFSQKLGVSPAILLVDADNAGKEIKELVEKNYETKIKVILLDDVPKIKEHFEDFEKVEIENLFTNTDRLIHFAIKNTNEMRINKIQQQSSYFKNKIKSYIDRKQKITFIDKKTKENFYTVLEYLKDEIEGLHGKFGEIDCSFE